MASAAVPQRERIETAIARANASAGRAHTLKLDLVVQIGDRPAVARGELISTPSGEARLELRGANNLVERHVLKEGTWRAAREGLLLEDARFFLPPLFVLQASEAESLRSNLLSFGVASAPIGLMECGEEDCLILGDSQRDIPKMEGPALAGVDRYEIVKADVVRRQLLEFESIRLWFWAGLDEIVLTALAHQSWLDEEAQAETESSEPRTAARSLFELNLPSDWTRLSGSEPIRLAPMGEYREVSLGLDALGEWGPLMERVSSEKELGTMVPGPASLWVNREGYEIRGFETVPGGRVELGPLASFEGMLLPRWIRIEPTEGEPIQFEVVGAQRVQVEPVAFSDDWLLAVPPSPPQAPSAPQGQLLLSAPLKSN